ncbi:hypothetical protein CK203_020005 [Vitis vinifera]|uniref:Uncharacterized protein n=1 Tax=Vitis vinifera TaxID=29760 RepID=A0A438J2S9_VITVI|nr:hypothetical protein CK203_020005 [Vitis vinifera]
MGYIYVWGRSGGGRHIDADWSPNYEALVFGCTHTIAVHFSRLLSAEVAKAFTIGNPLGCRGSGCVEVMTTLHGSSPSLWRRAEGCVPPEGTIAYARDLLKSNPFPLRATSPWGLGQSQTGIDSQQSRQFVVQDETPCDSLPHLPHHLARQCRGPHHICYVVILRQLRLFGSSSTWDDLDSNTSGSPPAKFRMPDIERYMVVDCLLHLSATLQYCDEGPWVRRVTDDRHVSFISEWCSPALVHIFGVLARQDMG